MKTLAVIPARGGSKGIPHKNVRAIAGRPLIDWTIAAARLVTEIDRLIVSTDDPEIADIARAAGADVPFMRPAELASDTATGMAAVFHALDQLPGFDALLLLQPTSPLRAADDIRAAFRMMAGNAAPAIVSVCQPSENPGWMYRMDPVHQLTTLLPEATATRRQDHDAAWVLNGAIYLATVPWLREHQSFVAPGARGLPMPPERSVDIDTWLDWKLAELLLNETNGAPDGMGSSATGADH